MLVIKESDNNVDFKAEFYNPDGTTGIMCGNGARCAVRFAYENNFFKLINDRKTIRFQMVDIVFQAQLLNNSIRIFFPPPIELIEEIELNINEKIIKGGYVNIGSDHFVVNASQVSSYHGKDISKIDIEKFAKPIRYHNHFEPKGTNVNLYLVESISKIYLRTFERGVEAETGACGTGAISTALIASLKLEVLFPVTIIPTSGSPLIVDLESTVNNKIKAVSLEGNTLFIKQEKIEL